MVDKGESILVVGVFTVSLVLKEGSKEEESVEKLRKFLSGVGRTMKNWVSSRCTLYPSSVLFLLTISRVVDGPP